MSELPDHVLRNRASWDAMAREYEDDGRRCWAQQEPTWGIWGVPEAQVELLPPDLAGLDAIELGCGTGVRLCLAGTARCAPGGHRQLSGSAGHRPPPAGGVRTRVPAPARQRRGGAVAGRELRPRDLGAGASIWCDPYRWIPEAARLLRPNGRLVFLVNGVLLAVCVPEEDGVPATRPDAAAVLRDAPHGLAG